MNKPTFWKLFVAYLVDIIICQIVLFFISKIRGTIVGFILGAAGMYTPDNMNLLTVLALVGILVDLLFFVLYFAICEYCWGKTLGKKLMGLQVVQKEETK